VVYKKREVLACMLLLALAGAACAPSRVSQPESPGIHGYALDKSAISPASPLDAGGEAEARSDDRMIVRMAQLSLIVQDAEESLSQIKAIVSEMDGYVSDTRLWRQDEQLRGSVTVRVPTESLDDALTQFKALSVRVESESSSSEDVTEEYTDLGARLRNLEATEQELLELLTTVREKTGKAEDVLAVHRELTSIRGQIEQLKGRMQYLEKTSSLAAVTIELVPDALTRPISVGGWQPAGTLANALRSLLRTLQSVADAAIWVVFYVLPVAAVLLIPFVVAWLIWRARKKGKRVAKA